MDQVVKNALDNLTTGTFNKEVMHSIDEKKAKTFIRILYTKINNIPPDDVYTYLKNDLNCSEKTAKAIKKMIEFKNEGKNHQGIDKNYKPSTKLKEWGYVKPPKKQ